MPIARRPRLVVVALLALAPALLGPGLTPSPAAARAAPWRAPVDGPLVARFAYSPARPFARGQRRGVDLRAWAGERVSAPCAGTVVYAGRLPGFARGVSLRCGELTATVLGLAAASVRRGALVLPGAPLGVAGGRGSIRLGARVTAGRFAYRDPLTLLGRRLRAPEPLVGRRVRPRAPALPVTRPAPLVVRAPRAPTTVPVAAPAVSPVAWAGLVLLAVALPAGGLVARGRRRSSTARGAVVRRPRSPGRASGAG